MIWIFAIVYNTFKKAEQYIESIEQCKASQLRLCVIDNSTEPPSEGFVQKMRRNSSWIDYLKPQSNLGYFGGAQYGLLNYLENHKLPEWVIVSNVDITISEGTFFETLNQLTRRTDLAVVAPSIISARWNMDANPKYKFRLSYKRFVFYKYITKYYILHNAYLSLAYAKKFLKNKITDASKQTKPAAIENIYCAHGAFMIFHKQYFDRGGDFNHFSFLFGEEFFVAEKAIEMGLAIEYHPELRVIDYEHASTGTFYSRKISNYMHQSTLDILRYYEENQ